MADKVKETQGTDDEIRRCNSISRGTCLSRQSHRDRLSWRQQKIGRLAEGLKGHGANDEHSPPDDSKRAEPVAQKHHLNSSFHHYRFLVCILGGAGAGLMAFHRFNMTIAILHMVNQTHIYLEEHPDRTVDDFLDEGYMLGGEFNWNNEIVAIILAWYMFSYTLPQTLAARICDIIGCRLAVPISLAICAVSSLLTPAAAYLGWEYVVACRILNGLGASTLVPASLVLIENWMHFDEIPLGISLTLILYMGLIACTHLVSGFLTEIHWKHTFYAPSLFTLAFCALWLVLVTDWPETNWLISKRELDSLVRGRQEPLPVQNNGVPASHGLDSVKHNRESPGGGDTVEAQLRGPSHGAAAPGLEAQDLESYKPDSWLQIFQVPSFYAYLVVWTIYCVTNTALMFVMPAYMRQFLKIQISENGFYCFIIELGSILSAIWPHQMLRLLQGHFGLSLTQSSNASYFLCCAATAFTFIFVGTFHQWQLLMLFLNRAMQNANDAIITGSLMANYAKAGLSGLSFAVMNTIGNLFITGVSTLIGWWLDRSKSSVEGWQVIFTGLGVANLAAFVIFICCIDSKPVKFKNKRGSKCALEAHSGPEPPLKSTAPGCSESSPSGRDEGALSKSKSRTRPGCSD